MAAPLALTDDFEGLVSHFGETVVMRAITKGLVQSPDRDPKTVGKSDPSAGPGRLEVLTQRAQCAAGDHPVELFQQVRIREPGERASSDSSLERRIRLRLIRQTD